MAKKVSPTPITSSGLIGPYSLADLIKHKMDKNTKHSGVYVWGVLHKTTYYPIYVGKGGNICERLFQHIIRFNGGEYLIPAKDEIVNPNRNYPSLKKSYLKNKTLSKELLHFPTGSFDFDTFDKSKEITKARKFVRTNFFACWKVLPNYTDELSAIEEGNLANSIGRQKLIGTRYKASNGNLTFINDFLSLNFE
jgi:hypothetical protein